MPPPDPPHLPATVPGRDGAGRASAPDTILVVPCYNEARNLDPDAFEALARSGEAALLFVDDGSTDATPRILAELSGRVPGAIEVATLPANRGKAVAVRHGMLRAFERGPAFAGYWDGDLATPLGELPRFRALLEADERLELVMGARVKLLGREIDRKTVRHYGGRVFATCASMTLGLPVYDTQCGAKLFRNTAVVRGLFEEPFLTGWTFDVELLARLVRARRAAGLGSAREAVVELPLATWRDVGVSSVRATDFLRSLLALARIHLHYRPRSG